SPISGGARYGSGARKTGRPGSGSSGWPTTGSRNRESFIRGQRAASLLDTQGGSRMPELGPYGSVRGARGNSRPYRERHLLTLSSSQFDPDSECARKLAKNRRCKSPTGKVEPPTLSP